MPGGEAEGRFTFPKLGRFADVFGAEGLCATDGRETGFPPGVDGLDTPNDGRGVGVGRVFGLLP